MSESEIRENKNPRIARKLGVCEKSRVYSINYLIYTAGCHMYIAHV